MNFHVNHSAVKDVSIAYIDTGLPRPGAETLVFVHGAGGNLTQFQPQLEFFARSYRVLVPSLRGHGQSGCPREQGLEAFRLDVMARDLIELFGQLETGPVHLVGNSAGGIMGFELARQRPELLKSLAIFGTTAKMAFPQFLKDFTLWFDTRNVTKNPEKKLKALSKYTSKLPGTREQVCRMFLQATKAIPGFRYALGAYDYLPVIRELQIPLCILKAQYDRDINLVLKDTIAAMERHRIKTGLPSRVVELAGVGHIANLDDPDLFNRTVDEWLSSLAPSRG